MARRERKKFDPKSIRKMEHMAILSVVLFAVISVAVTFLTGMDGVWDKFHSLSLQTWAILLSLSLVNYVCRGMKWHLFGERLGMNVPIKRMAMYYFSGMAMTVTPGKLGTGLRLWFLNKCHKISYSKGLPLMIMDPITDLASLFIMCLAGFVSFGGGEEASLAVFGAILGGLMLLFTKPKLFTVVIKGFYRLFGKRKPRAFVAMKRMVHNMTNLVSPKVFTSTVFFSILGWGASVYAFHAVLTHMGGDISFLQAMFVFSFATILGGATMAPGGLGGTEASMMLLLIALGVDKETALAATLVIRTTTLWFGVFVGFCWLPFTMKLAKKQAA